MGGKVPCLERCPQFRSVLIEREVPPLYISYLSVLYSNRISRISGKKSKEYDYTDQDVSAAVEVGNTLKFRVSYEECLAQTYNMYIAQRTQSLKYHTQSIRYCIYLKDQKW